MLSLFQEAMAKLYWVPLVPLPQGRFQQFGLVDSLAVESNGLVFNSVAGKAFALVPNDGARNLETETVYKPVDS